MARKVNRKSSIVRLDPRIRDAVDNAVREGRASVDDIVALIKSMGGRASRSAVGRYVKGATAEMEHYRQAQHLAKVWAEQIPKNGDVAQLSRDVLTSLAFRAASQLAEDDDINGKEVMLLAKALRDISSSSKLGAEARKAIRAEILAEQQEQLRKLETDAAAGKGDYDLATLKKVRQVYGLEEDTEGKP